MSFQLVSPSQLCQKPFSQQAQVTARQLALVSRVFPGCHTGTEHQVAELTRSSATPEITLTSHGSRPPPYTTPLA